MFFQSFIESNIRQEFENSDFEYPSLLGPLSNRSWALGQIISKTIPIALVFAGIATFVFLILSGWNWITAADDESKLEIARSRITNALIGLAIVASSLAISNIISKFFSIDQFDSNLCDNVICPPGFFCNPSTGGCERP